jgi:hypothetical protein
MVRFHHFWNVGVDMHPKSQVLIPESMKFRDLSFPANISSIIPTSYWAKLGLPPTNFVHWRHLEDVGTELGCDHLFAHQTSFLKTYDRRVMLNNDQWVNKPSSSSFFFLT